MNRFSRRRKSKGASTVEFALVLPIALVLMLSIIDLSLYFYHEAAMSHVLRTALRNAVTNRRIENPDYPTNSSDQYLSRLETARQIARNIAPPLIDISATNGTNDNLFFVNVTDPSNPITNPDDLGGTYVKVKGVLQQEVGFITPFYRFFNGGDFSDNTMEVTTTFSVQSLVDEF